MVVTKALEIRFRSKFCRQPYPAKPHGFTIGATMAPDLSASLDTTVKNIQRALAILIRSLIKQPHLVDTPIIRLGLFNQPSTVAFPLSSQVLR